MIHEPSENLVLVRFNRFIVVVYPKIDGTLFVLTRENQKYDGEGNYCDSFNPCYN